MGTEIIGTRLWLINFYHEQLRKFKKMGLGNYTEHDVKITPTLMEVTTKRLEALTTVYDARMTPQALKLRLLKRLRKKGQLNGKTNGNGTVTTSSSKDNSNTGHERSKS